MVIGADSQARMLAVFLRANALSNTEAKIVVEHHLNAREIRLDHASDRVRKTYEYLSQFSIQQNRSNMDALREYVKLQILLSLLWRYGCCNQ